MPETTAAREGGSTPASPFGTVFAERMALVRYAQGQWTDAELAPLAPLSLHPAAHVLHCGSACFEGLKAFRLADGRVAVFRLDAHLDRFRRSAELLCLPFPPPDLVEAMIRELVDAVARPERSTCGRSWSAPRPVSAPRAPRPPRRCSTCWPRVITSRAANAR
ncbi:MAG: hypothetical protein U5K33_09665 [Halofilum sp. (in: g-proteobacteria)]|nr:hypothetical protein [Halofilum sp. (in: g-proteobacteria)]